MNAPTASATSTRRAPMPGIHVADRLTLAPATAGLPTGVPVFVGFAEPDETLRERPDAAAVVLKRWDAADFDARLRPARESHLRAAVRGYFANGGTRCVVLPVDPSAERSPASALAAVFERGGLLEDRSDIDLVCVPDAACSLVEPVAGLAAVHDAVLSHCERMGDRFALLDAPWMDAGDADDVVARLLELAASRRSALGALYFPWIAVEPKDRAAANEASMAAGAAWRCRPAASAEAGGVDATQPTRWVPPCGHVAGLVARVDRLAGAQHSPANELLEGALDVAMRFDRSRYGRLNEGGINLLRSLRGRGVDVGGARTLSGQSTWMHVSTARVVTGFRRWLAEGMREFAFEPNTPALQDAIRIRLTTRCLEMLRGGALVGGSAAQAFSVQCDTATNSAEDRELGRIVAHVGLAPSVPAEFIMVRVVQDASGFIGSGLA